MNAAWLMLCTLALLALGLTLRRETATSVPSTWSTPAPPEPASGAGVPVERMEALEAQVQHLARDLDLLDPGSSGNEAGGTQDTPVRSVRAQAQARLRIRVEALEADAVQARLEAQRLRRLRELGLRLGPLDEATALDLLKQAEAELSLLTRRMLEDQTGHLPETHEQFDVVRLQWQARLREALGEGVGRTIGEHFLSTQ